MPIRSIDWWNGKKSGGYDIHVLRDKGASLRLDKLLAISGRKVNPGGTTSDVTIITDRDDATLPGALVALGVTKVEFVARLANPATLAVTVDVRTGTVSTTSSTPLTLRNFLVSAKVHHTTAGLTTPLEIFVRVHVHGSVEKAWLTPSILTVHKDVGNTVEAPRFTLLAQFDDETVGDISEVPGIDWAPKPGSGEAVAVSTEGGITVRIFPRDPTVTATLPAKWGGMQASAKVLATGPWSELFADGPAAWLLSGPGRDRLTEVPNVLFIPEGFQDTPSDREVFDELLNKLLDWLRRSMVTRPYDLFFNSQKTRYTDSINYWSVFLPSRERAASLLAEMTRLDQPGGAIVGDPLPPAIPPLPTGAWSIGNLIFQVGLPIPGDLNATLGAKIEEWRGLFGAEAIPAGKVTPELFNTWIVLTLRTLANERDTVLGACAGERPRVERQSVPRALGLHPFRTKRSHMNQLLETLTDGQGGPAIGKTWTTGKDHDLVFAIVAGAPALGAFSPDDIICAGLGTDFRFLLKPVTGAEAASQGTRAVDVDPYPLEEGWPTGVRLPTGTIGTIVHELSHAFGLGDEYGADGFRFPNNRLRFLAQSGNVQPESELETFPGSGDLDSDKLRWRWPRIKNAGVLEDSPVLIAPGPPKEYVLSLRPGHKHLFEVGETVFLRQRPLLKKPTQQKPELVNPAKVSDPLEVVSAGNQLLEQIVVRDITGTLKPADFLAREPETAIVLRPHAAQPTPDAQLVAEAVRVHIKGNKRPLNRRGGDACSRDDKPVQEATNAPANLRFPGSLWGQAPLRWLVGAFDGGATFFCGIYHPTGECLMRSSSETGGGDVTTFCPVCRYLLVDRVDPYLHGPIDEHYKKIYPSPP